MNRKGKKLAIILYIIGAIGLLTGSFVEIKNESALVTAKKDYNNLFIDNVPKSTVTINEVKTVIKEAKKISKYNKKEQERILADLADYENYLSLKNEILKEYNGNAIVSSLTKSDITNFKKANANLKEKYKKSINAYLIDMEEQRKIIDDLEKNINDLFEDSDKIYLKATTTEKQIKQLKNTLTKLPQKNIVEENIDILNNANDMILKRNEEINTSWIKLNVPYISQNKNNVLNGCEAATLLMALQYKGYLKNMTLQQYATNMPKSASNNAYEGFTHDIFREEPSNVPHWIAPNALAEYGKSSSGNQTVFNTTNWTVDQLDQELENNNPVIIYVTAKFKPLKNWVEGAPTNVHIMLLVGYNRITGQQLLIDPWTHDDGRTSWIVEKSELENIYNAVGKKSVLVK